MSLKDLLEAASRSGNIRQELPALNMVELGRLTYLREVKRRILATNNKPDRWSDVEAAIATNLMVENKGQFVLRMILEGPALMEEFAYSLRDSAALKFARKMFGPDVQIKIKLQATGWTIRLDHGLPESGGGGAISPSTLGFSIPQGITHCVIEALLAIEEAKANG